MISSLFKKKKPQHKVLVLMYHRVAAENRDPWELCVSPKHFEEQLQWLKENFPVISLQALAEQVSNKAIHSHAVCLSFDDGYADNYHVAKPLLEKYKIPATFFIPTHNLLTGTPFWWDELESVLFDTEQLPRQFSGNVNGQPMEADLGEEAVLNPLLIRQQNGWTWPQPPPTKRSALYFRLWEQLKPLPWPQLQAALQEIKDWAGVTQINKPALLPMKVAELQSVAALPLFDIGIHTLTHPALSAHPFDVQKKEIEGNKAELEALCGRPVNMIAFPYGDYNETTLEVVRKLHLSAAFCTKAFPVTNLSSPASLGRFQVKNRDKEAFANAVSGWFNIS